MRSGVLAEFDTAEGLARAIARVRALGYTRVSLWTPYPIHGLAETAPQSDVPSWMLGGGILGAIVAYVIEWWCNARSYPIDVGGHPLHSAPAFIPITFESAVLASSLTGFFLLLGRCGFPRLYHPVFTVPGFERAAVDRFWIGLDDADPRYDLSVCDELSHLGALRCERVGGTT